MGGEGRGEGGGGLWAGRDLFEDEGKVGSLLALQNSKGKGVSFARKDLEIV